MKVTIEISNEHLQELLPYLTKNSAGHIKIAKDCIKDAVSEIVYAEIERGHNLSASALEKYLRKMKSEYIRFKEWKIGRKLQREDFIKIIDNRI